MTNLDNNVPVTEPVPDLPHHGYQGDREVRLRKPFPTSLTVAISREAGTRGSSIARKIGERLGWQVYTSDLFEYSSQDERVRQDIYESLSPEAVAWVDQAMANFAQEYPTGQHTETREVARLVLALGAQGDLVIVGRGACCVLPAASTLKVRFVAPLPDRIAYMSQWMRLTWADAEKQVALHDRMRDEFVRTHFHKSPHDPHQYDLILNTSLLGEELSAELVIQAAKMKLAHWLENTATNRDCG
jgi:cytidylate kinase